MRKTALLGFTFACAACASHPAPTQHLASSMAAVRGAQEVGAAQVPRAALHMKLAEDEVAQAKQLMNEGKNERADYMTLRAYNDAALAIALTRENAARDRAEQASEKAKSAPAPAPPPSPAP